MGNSKLYWFFALMFGVMALSVGYYLVVYIPQRNQRKDDEARVEYYNKSVKKCREALREYLSESQETERKLTEDCYYTGVCNHGNVIYTLAEYMGRRPEEIDWELPEVQQRVFNVCMENEAPTIRLPN